jgi:hypothetical protein
MEEEVSYRAMVKALQQRAGMGTREADSRQKKPGAGTRQLSAREGNHGGMHHNL